LVPDTGKYFRLIIPVIVLVLIPVFYFLDPGEMVIFPKCPFYLFTGCYCPGCGSQRAIHSLVHFRLAEALHQNFLIIPAALLILYHCIFRFFNRKFGWKLPDILYNKKTPWIILLIVIVFWIIRNIPFEPFCRLAPC